MSKVRITVVQAKDILIAKHLLLAVKSTKLIKVWMHTLIVPIMFKLCLSCEIYVNPNKAFMKWKKCVQCAAGGPKSAVWRNPAAAVYSSHGAPEYSFMINQQKCGETKKTKHYIPINFV